MSAHELRARSRAVFTQICEEASHRLGVGLDPDLGVRPEAGTATFNDPFIDEDERLATVEALRANHREYVDEIVRAADALCRHEFALFGMVARFGEAIPWQADPVSGNRWPNEFHTRVRIFDGNGGHGDVKYVWELNRHQFLPVLGKAYRLTGDEKYASKGLELIESWIDANPFNVGINWTSALEVAVRSLSWCWACALFEGSPSLTSPRRQRILGSLAQHARHIERHLSFYFSPYNHLIGEATALFVIGSLCPILRQAAEWRDRGWAILESEMPRQYHADGGTVEQASGYHHFTLGFHLHAVLVRRRVQGDAAGPMWTNMEKAVDFSMRMMRPDGSMPMIGDGDEGRAIALEQRDLWDFRTFLAIGAVLFGRSDFKKLGGALPPDAAWLVGTSGRRVHGALGETLPDVTSQALAASGYYIMRTGWDPQAHYLGFDCGELAAGVSTDDTVSAAHGHADALSVEVSAFGEPLLVDPGFWTYNGEVEWHRYFRETEAHNTVVVDGRSQAEFRGRLKWSHAPVIERHEWITLGALDYAEGSHSGYRRLSSPVTHRRVVLFLKPHYWVVRDELIGDDQHALDRCFHFATADVVHDAESGGVHTRLANGRPNLAVVPVERDDLLVELVRGGPASPVGWMAVGYERKVQAATAKFRVTSSLPCALHSVLVPFRGDAPWVRVTARQIESSGLQAASGAGRWGPASERQGAGVGAPRLTNDRAFEVSRPGGRDIWAFSSGTSARFHDGWFTDARTTCVQLNESGNVVGCALTAGSRIDVDGESLITLDRPVRAAALSIVEGRPVVELSEPATVVACAFEQVIRKAG
jgi:hypothetical protein